jgi:hypothetical protein
MTKAVLLLAVLALFSSLALASSSVVVGFPSDNTWYSSAGNGSDFMGNNGGFSAPLYTQGDSISETFVTGQTLVNSLTVDWSLINYFGNNPGASYENDIYINGAFVGYFLVDDCGFCSNVLPITGTVNFNPIYGFGTYTISVVLAQTAPVGGGTESFTEWNAAGAAATATLGTPEPGSIALFGSGLLGFAGMLQRKIWS